MALSRVRCLSELCSIGLTSSIRELIDLGPPEGFRTRFNSIFKDTIADTHTRIEEALLELGWNN